jgi:hypothetical protein
MAVGMHTVIRWSLQKSELVVNTEVDTTACQTDLWFTLNDPLVCDHGVCPNSLQNTMQHSCQFHTLVLTGKVKMDVGD